MPAIRAEGGWIKVAQGKVFIRGLRFPRRLSCHESVAYPGIFFGGVSTNSVEDRENGDLGAVAPLVRGSGGNCNLVQEISFHIVKFS